MGYVKAEFKIVVTCKEEDYETKLKELVDDVKSGKFQREMMESEKSKVTATVQLSLM